MIKNLDIVINKFKNYYLKQVGEVILVSYEDNIVFGEIAYYDDQTDTIDITFIYQGIKHNLECRMLNIDDKIIPLRIINLKNSLARMHSGAVQKLKIWDLVYMLASINDDVVLINSTKLLLNSNDIDEGFNCCKGQIKKLSSDKNVSIKGQYYTLSYKKSSGISVLNPRNYNLCFFVEELELNEIQYIKELILPFFNLGKYYVANNYNFIYEDQFKLFKEAEKKLTEFNINLICKRFNLTRELLELK